MMIILTAKIPRNIDGLEQKLWIGGQRKLINNEQKQAIERALDNNFQLIQGPPGIKHTTIM